MPTKIAPARTREGVTGGDGETMLPYAVPVGGGRNLVVLLSPQHYEFDPDGELLLRPAGVRHLDKARAAATDVPDRPSPGWVKALRAALGLTQSGFGAAVGVTALTVSRWERGQVRPGSSAVGAMRALRRRRASAGVVVDA